MPLKAGHRRRQRGRVVAARWSHQPQRVRGARRRYRGPQLPRAVGEAVQLGSQLVGRDRHHPAMPGELLRRGRRLGLSAQLLPEQWLGASQTRPQPRRSISRRPLDAQGLGTAA